MRKYVCIVLQIMLLFGVASSGHTLVESTVIGVFLDEIEQTAQSILEHAQNATDNVVNNAAFNIIHTARQLREQYEHALDSTFAQLDEHERRLFDSLEAIVDQLFLQIEDEHDRIDDTLDNLAIYLSDSVFVDDVPRISRFLTRTAVHGRSEGIPLTIRFKGKNLHHDSNRLLVSTDDGGFELEPVELSDNEISFDLSRQWVDLLSSPDRIRFIQVDLSLFKGAGLFEQRKTYRYLVRVLPQELATLAFHYSETVQVVSESTRRVFEGPTGFFRSPIFRTNKRTVSMTQPPDEGFKIDPRTVSVDWKGSDGCWVARSNCSARPGDGVATASCTIVSENSTRGMRGCSFSTTLSFTQYKVIDQVRKLRTEMIPLTYGMPVLWNIPTETQFDRLEVRMFDGTTVFYDNDAETALMEIAINRNSQTVVVSYNLDLEAFF